MIFVQFGSILISQSIFRQFIKLIMFENEEEEEEEEDVEKE